MPVYATKVDVYTRNGTFDEIVNNSFESAVLLDKSLTVIHYYKIPDHILPFFELNKNSTTQIKRLISYLKENKSIYFYDNSYFLNIIPVIENNKHIAYIIGISSTDYSKKDIIIGESRISRQESDRNLKLDSIFSGFIGSSPGIVKLIEKCKKLALLNQSVLISGETGTGKDTLAKCIHAASYENSEAPFLKVNCSSLRNEATASCFFDPQKNGTIYLDKIDQMDINLQSDILRIVEENTGESLDNTNNKSQFSPFNRRIIASSAKNLAELSRQGAFRPELYFRLSAFELVIPPLRERREDIPLLINHFVRESNYSLQFSNEAMNLIMNYDWPGNVLQLKNIINALAIFNESNLIEESDVREVLRLSPLQENSESRNNCRTLNSHVHEEEKLHILRVLLDTNMNVAEAARQLNITRRTMYNKIHKYGIKLNRFNQRQS